MLYRGIAGGEAGHGLAAAQQAGVHDFLEVSPTERLGRWSVKLVRQTLDG